MKRYLVTAVSIFATAAFLLICAPVQGGETEHHTPAPSKDPRFEFMKKLEGTWVSEASEHIPGGTYEYRITAGGHAVEEREMIGTPMEMMTVYYMDGDDLIADHFCMLGNRPRLKAARKISNKTLSFECAGVPGGAKSHDDQHVHGWSMKLAADGRLHYDAELIDQGRPTRAPSAILVRQPERHATNR